MESSKRRTIPLAAAALWLVAISAAFAILSLAMIGTSAARIVLAALAVAVLVYVAIGIGVIRAVVRSPGAVPPRTPEGRIMTRRFVYVVVAEVAAIMVANAILAIARHVDAIVPMDVLIVGIHFLPLARLFRVPRYYTMGALFCIVSLLVLALVPANTQIGSAAAWFALPALGLHSRGVGDCRVQSARSLAVHKRRSKEPTEAVGVVNLPIDSFAKQGLSA